MHRRTYIHLTVLAAAMVLAAGATRPVRAQTVGLTPAVVRAFPRSGAILLTWDVVTTATGYNVYRREAGQTPDKAALVNTQMPTPLPSLLDSGLTNGKAFIYSVKAVGPDASGKPVEGPASPEVVATPQDPILNSFVAYNIDTLNPGSVTVQGNDLTIRAAGQDVWQEHDGQTFLATPVTDDYQITMQLTAKPKGGDQGGGGGAGFGKVGLEIRPDLDKRSPYAIVFASVDRDPGMHFEGRTGHEQFGDGGPSRDDMKFPVSMRLVKKGAMLSAFYSFDGTTFTQIGDAHDYLILPNVTYVGVFATAHDDTTYVEGKVALNSIKIEKAP
jgi:hypothetical protein